MSLASLDPVATPLLLWHEDCIEGTKEESIRLVKEEHPEIVHFFARIASHSHASVFPSYTSMWTFCIGAKKDVISIFYSFSTNELTLEYHPKGFIDDGAISQKAYRGSADGALELITEMLDLFVARHKRLPKPKTTT